MGHLVESKAYFDRSYTTLRGFHAAPWKQRIIIGLKYKILQIVFTSKITVQKLKQIIIRLYISSMPFNYEALLNYTFFESIALFNNYN